MTCGNWLFVFIVGLLGLTGYLIATRPVITLDTLDTPEEETEEEWWG